MAEEHRITIEDGGCNSNIRAEANGRPPMALVGTKGEQREWAAMEEEKAGDQ